VKFAQVTLGVIVNAAPGTARRVAAEIAGQR
jgi:hypothetical protein